MTFVDVYSWIQRFQHDALQDGDIPRLQLVEYQTLAWQHFEANPQQSLSYLQSARDLAETLHESCWMLYYDSWIGECLNLYLNDFKQGIQHAMQTVVEIRKPQYAHCTMLCRGYRIVIESYIYSDPVGYADKIRELIKYTDNEIPIDYDTYGILKKRESELEFALGRLQPAIESALDYLRRSSEQMVTFHMMYAYEMLVHYFYLLGNNHQAHELIIECENMARANQRLSLVAIAQAWRALFTLIEGDESSAESLYRLATSNMSQLGMSVSLSYYEAICSYNERIAQPAQALAMRQKQYEDVRGRGGYYLETEVLLKIARLQGRMGLELTDTIEVAHQTAEHLLQPTHLLQRLQVVEDGTYTEDFT